MGTSKGLAGSSSINEDLSIDLSKKLCEVGMRTGLLACDCPPCGVLQAYAGGRGAAASLLNDTASLALSQVLTVANLVMRIYPSVGAVLGLT